MRITKRRVVVIVGATAALALIGAGAAVASNDDDATDRSIQGTELQRATDAALAQTGQGKVTGTEVDDEESYYEVEVTLDDGSQVDVQLDRAFQVVSADADHETDR
jgi:uncharacterized membrane protein YkoI